MMLIWADVQLICFSKGKYFYILLTYFSHFVVIEKRI